MSRSGENIHKRKDGRWEARLQLVDEEGVKRSRSLYGKTYREAKNKLLDARQHGYNRKKESPFFEEVAWEWLRVQRAEHKGAMGMTFYELRILDDVYMKKHRISAACGISIAASIALIVAVFILIV